MRATTGSWDGVCSTPPAAPLSRSGTLQPFSFVGGSGPLPRLVEPPSPSSTPPPPVGMDQHLLAVTNLTLMAGTERALNSMDAELLTPLLRLCCAALLYMPEVLAMPSTLDTLLTMTQASARCCDMEQCREWLKWVTLLCCAPFGGNPAASSQPAPNNCASATAVASALLSSAQGGNANVGGQGQLQGAMAGSSSGSRGGGKGGGVAFATTPPPSNLGLRTSMPLGSGPMSEGLVQLATRLDANAGSQLLLALLLAASGDMPADLILPIATALHQIWGAVGTSRFARWLEVALLVMSPEHAPWHKMKLESKSAFLQELLSQDMETDITRFKRHIKAFCGGKKKQGRFDTMWQSSRSMSHSPSHNSSVQ